jgi:putative chitinase
MGNGDELSGDGYKYRGKGFIQLTGKNNTTAFAKAINKSLDDAVQYLTTIEGALASACWFWNTNGLNAIADTKDVLKMTNKINGGTIGLKHRQELYTKAMEIIV